MSPLKVMKNSGLPFFIVIATTVTSQYIKLMFQTTQKVTRSKPCCLKITTLDFPSKKWNPRILNHPCFVWFQRGDVHLLGCPRRLVKGLHMGSNPNIRFWWVGQNPFTIVITIHLLSSCDILVETVIPDVFEFIRHLWLVLLRNIYNKMRIKFFAPWKLTKVT